MASPKDLKINMFHLLLSFNSYIPPLRHDWIEMNIYPPRVKNGQVVIFNTSFNHPPPEDNDNYLWEEKQDQWSIVINRIIEKSNVRAKAYHGKLWLNDEVCGVTNGKKINEIINDSLKNARRNLVLIGITTTTMMQSLARLNLRYMWL